MTFTECQKGGMFMKTKIAILLGVFSPVFFIIGVGDIEGIWKTIFWVLFFVSIIAAFILGGTKGLGYFARKTTSAAGKVWKWSITFHFSIIYVPYAMFKLLFGACVALFILFTPIIPLLMCPWVLLMLNKKAEI